LKYGLTSLLRELDIVLNLIFWVMGNGRLTGKTFQYKKNLSKMNLSTFHLNLLQNIHYFTYFLRVENNNLEEKKVS
jgi:hypothetical protein